MPQRCRPEECGRHSDRCRPGRTPGATGTRGCLGGSSHARPWRDHHTRARAARARAAARLQALLRERQNQLEEEVKENARAKVRDVARSRGARALAHLCACGLARARGRAAARAEVRGVPPRASGVTCPAARGSMGQRAAPRAAAS